jgi:hypothetical protein
MFVSDRKLELEFASLLEGSYVGEIVMLDGCYGVQLVGVRAITSGRLRQRSRFECG